MTTWEHPFYLHVWAIHLRFLPFGSVISHFQQCQHSKFSCLFRRNLGGFDSWTGGKLRFQEKHHGNIASGICKASEHIPRPGNALVLLKKGSKCCTNAPHEIAVSTRELRIRRPHLDHHECTLFRVRSHWRWSESSLFFWGARISVYTRKCNTKAVANAVWQVVWQSLSIVHSYLHLQAVSLAWVKKGLRFHAMQVAI